MRTIDPILNRYGTADRDVLGGRAWIKTKNREYRRYEMERELAIDKKRWRMFV